MTDEALRQLGIVALHQADHLRVMNAADGRPVVFLRFGRHGVVFPLDDAQRAGLVNALHHDGGLILPRH